MKRGVCLCFYGDPVFSVQRALRERRPEQVVYREGLALKSRPADSVFKSQTSDSDALAAPSETLTTRLEYMIGIPER